MESDTFDKAIDKVSGALMVIDYGHHEEHEGDAFKISHLNASVAANSYISVYMKTPNTSKLVHMVWEWASGGAAYFNVREGPVVTGNTGTAKAPKNKRRGSSTTSGVINNASSPASNSVSTDVTIADRTASVAGDKGGLLLHQDYDGIAKTAQGGNRNNDEFILAPNTVYVFECQAIGNNIPLLINLKWYEHTDRTAP